MNDYTENDEMRRELRMRVVDFAIEAFHKRGVKEVTMDEISHGLGMSKRTLYQLFADKEQLLFACVDEGSRREYVQILQLAAQTDNVLETLLLVFDHKMRSLKDVSPRFTFDIERYPSVAEYIVTKKSEYVKGATEFFLRGVKQGYFRDDVDFDIVLKSVDHAMSHALHNADFRNMNLVRLFVNIVVVYIRGCATMKGTLMMDEFLTNYRALH